MSIIIVLLTSRKNPLYAFHVLWDNRKDKKLWFHFLLLGCILLINKLELLIEKSFIHAMDKSVFFMKYEGDLLAFFQDSLKSTWLTELTTFFYIIIFVALIVSSFVIYFTQADKKLFYMFIYAIGLNYLIAIPFYLFFPINEVWYVHSQVHFLIPEVYPAFESQYRHLSGLNNCFPSLHNSISLTLLLLSYKSSNKLFKSIMTVSVAIIMFSTIYLGIHWFTDQAAGIVLAIFAVTLAQLISKFVEQPAKAQKNLVLFPTYLKKKTLSSEVKRYKNLNQPR